MNLTKNTIMNKKVRAKFQCHQVAPDGYGNKNVHMHAVYGQEGENKDFTDATPSGNLTIAVSGDVPSADFFEQGKEYYLDFTEATV